MATGTAQLLPTRQRQENDVSTSEEDVDGEPLPPVPVPVKDGLPQVSSHSAPSLPPFSLGG